MMKSFLYPLVLLLLTIPAFRFMLQPGLYYNMQDDMQLIRQIEFEDCLHDGQIPCRWTPRLGYGYGYPEFNFYPPLPYIFGQIFRTFGTPYIETVKLGAILQFLAMALSMYLLGRQLFGRLGGFLSALFYSYAPYHALNIYVRGAYNEAWASVFFPLLFLFSYRLIHHSHRRDLIFFALSLALLLLSHNPMAMTLAPILGIWCFFWIIRRRNFASVPQLAIASIFGLGLAAFYTLPVVFEAKYVQIDTMFKNYFDFRAHFPSLYQLFISNFWGDGPSVWGTADGMSFSIGYLHWILPSLLFLYILYDTIRYRRLRPQFLLPLILLFTGLFVIFLTHEKSTPLWLILTPLQKIQFSWRLLNHISFLSSLLIGFIPFIFKKFRLPLTIILSLLVIAVNLRFFYPVTYGRLKESEKFSGQSWVNQITSGIYDYLPKTARIAAQGPAKEYIDQIEPLQEYRLYGQKKGTDWLFFNIDLNQPAKITLPLLYFPNFQVFDFDQQLKIAVEPELGRIVINLSSGNHQIYVKLHNTPIRTVANIISLASWILLLALAFITSPQDDRQHRHHQKKIR